MKKILLTLFLLFTVSAVWFGFSNTDTEAKAEEKADFVGASAAFGDALREGKNSVSIENFSIPKTSMDMLFQYAQLENPDVFWFPTSISYSFPENGNIVSEITWENSYDNFSEIENMRKEYEKYALEAVNVCFESGMSDFDKILSAHDYLTERTNYVLEDAYSFTAYSVFVRKEGVCQGYAYAFKHLMDIAGIECYYASSPSLEHGWNVVCLDGEYYYVDVTHDDPVTEYNNTVIEYGCETHEKLLCSENQFRCEANDIIIWCPDGTPKCNSTKYDNAFFRNVKGAAEYIDGEWYFVEEREKLSDARRIMKYDGENVSAFLEFKSPVYSVDNHMGTLYVASKNLIYSVDKNGNMAEFCSTVGDIFGCFSMEGSLHYGVYKKKNFSLCTKTLPAFTDICQGISVEANSVEAILHFYIKQYIELGNGTIRCSYGDEEKTLSIRNVKDGIISFPFPVCEIETEVKITISLNDSTTSYSASIFEYANKISQKNFDEKTRNIAKALAMCITGNKNHDYSSIKENAYILDDKSEIVDYIKTEAETGEGITLKHSFSAPTGTEFLSNGNAYSEETENSVTIHIANISPLLFHEQFIVATDNFQIRYSVLDFINLTEDEEIKGILFSHYLYGKALLEYRAIGK